MSTNHKPRTKTTHELALDRVSTPPTEENNVTDLVKTSTPDGVMGLIQSAIAGNVPVEVYERLVALHERISDRQARISYNGAMAAFQAECPIIPRRGEGKITTEKGGNFRYAYAELEDIEKTAGPFLIKNGFSYTWDTETHSDMIKCICTLRHIDGHAASASFGAPIDDRPNRAVSPAQKTGATVTYCRRQSLIQVAGLRVGDPDTDASPGEKISESQRADLQSLIEEVGAEKRGFLKYMKVSSLEQIPVSDLKKATTALEQKRTSQ